MVKPACSSERRGKSSQVESRSTGTDRRSDPSKPDWSFNWPWIRGFIFPTPHLQPPRPDPKAGHHQPPPTTSPLYPSLTMPVIIDISDTAIEKTESMHRLHVWGVQTSL